MGAIVWPWAYWKMRPRQTRNPPRGTMKGGTPPYETRTSTMPVAMIAIDELWTDRFHRFRAVRNSPPDMMLKPIQMIARAPIMPSSRVSISIDRRSDRGERPAGPRVAAPGGAAAPRLAAAPQAG